MRIHREGISTLIFALIVFIILIVFINLFVDIFWLKSILILPLVVIYILIVWFFRNPERKTSSQPLDLVAPVDGKVVEIKETEENEYLKGKCRQISIFMSPLNVHVCRYPVSGEVTYTKYHPGKYLVAFHPKSSDLNERTTVVVENKGGQVLFRQIAGAVARRIVLYPEKGDKAKAGSEYGFIKFGSRLDVFLPLDAEVNINLGDIVKGGTDIIGKLIAKK